MRTILHVDMDAFFAAIEMQRHPELRGLPVVIGGRGNPLERGVVSTASYEARRFGIHSAMPLRTAYRLCPQAIFLPVDIETYAAVSARIMALLRQFSLPMEEAGIDEAFIDASEAPQPVEEIARTIKQRLKDEFHLTGSIGIGPNRLLAKLASDLAKPDGILRLSIQDLESRIWPLSVRRLQGVGPKTERRLAAIGVKTVGDLARKSKALLTREVGPAHACHLHQAAWGVDQSELTTAWKAQSMGREITFQRDVRTRGMIHGMLDRLAREVADGLRAEGFVARSVCVKIRLSNFETHTRSCRLPSPDNDPQVLMQAAAECLERLPLSRPVRLVGIRAEKLEHAV